MARKNGSVAREWEQVLFKINLIVIVFTLIGGIGESTVSSAQSGIILVCCAIFVGLLVLWFLRGFARTLDQAFDPLPTPQQIYADLTAGLGRPAKLEEVAAVRQMLAQDKQLSQVGVAAVLGGAYLIGHQTHH